jgi:type IV pilus assembly protein PilA
MLRRSTSDERGSTIVELLVVIIMVGILAMIALPAFLGQRTKAQDSEAHAMIRTAQVTLLTYQAEHDTFDVEREDLEKVEPAVREATADFDVKGTTERYTISERSHSDTLFTLTRDEHGKTTRTCNVPGHGLCRATPDADDNSW